MSARKRPICHSCGSPMAGHKRPQGVPICPSDPVPLNPAPSDPAPSVPAPARAHAPSLKRQDAEFIIPESGRWHRRNPNWVSPAPVVPSPSISSWVPTEPADDISIKGEGSQEDEGYGEEDEDEFGGHRFRTRKSPSYASTSTTTARIRRSLSKVIVTSIPLVSLFKAPAEDASAWTRTAQKHGLAATIMRTPRRTVKSEQTRGKDDSVWVAMGQDGRAVERLVDIHEHEQEDAEAIAIARNEKVGAYPIDIRAIRMTFLDVIIAGAIGGFIVFYGLSLL